MPMPWHAQASLLELELWFLMVKTSTSIFNGPSWNLSALFLRQCGSWDRQWHRNASLKLVFNHSVTLLEWVEMICPRPKFRSHIFPTNGQKCEVCTLGNKLKHITSQHCPAKPWTPLSWIPRRYWSGIQSILRWNALQNCISATWWEEFHMGAILLTNLMLYVILSMYCASSYNGRSKFRILADLHSDQFSKPRSSSCGCRTWRSLT